MKGATHFSGPLLSSGGRHSRKMRNFLNGLPVGFNQTLVGRGWYLDSGMNGGPNVSGANTALYNAGMGLKLQGDADTSRGSDDGFGVSTRGYFHGLTGAAANAETALLGPRVYDVTCPVATDGPITTFIRFRVADIASQDMLWGVADDEGDTVTLLDAGGAEDITNGVVFHREIGDAATSMKLSVVIAGSAVTTTVPLLGSVANDKWIDMGLIIARNHIEYMISHDASLGEAAIVSGIVDGTTPITAKNAIATPVGPSFALNGTDAAAEGFDIWAWGCAQPYA